jgi:hypothetical protein
VHGRLAIADLVIASRAAFGAAPHRVVFPGRDCVIGHRTCLCVGDKMHGLGELGPQRSAGGTSRTSHGCGLGETEIAGDRGRRSRTAPRPVGAAREHCRFGARRRTSKNPPRAGPGRANAGRSVGCALRDRLTRGAPLR